MRIFQSYNMNYVVQIFYLLQSIYTLAYNLDLISHTTQI